jgi:hypothetical protein
MRHPVSLVASLVFGLGTLAACSGEAGGKDQLASVCSEKARGSINCSCFTTALQTNLAPEQFEMVARAVGENRRFTGFIPTNLADDATIGASIAQAQASCPAA